MTLRRLCNVVYAMLAEGRDENAMRQLDNILAGDPAANERMAQRQLMGLE